MHAWWCLGGPLCLCGAEIRPIHIQRGVKVMSKLYKVIQATVLPGTTVSKVVRENLPKEKAEAVRDQLQEGACVYDPNKLVSYLIEPA